MIEISGLIYITDKLFGFYIMGALVVNVLTTAGVVSVKNSCKKCYAEFRYLFSYVKFNTQIFGSK